MSLKLQSTSKVLYRSSICVCEYGTNWFIQDTYSFSRKKDSKGAVGDWTAETAKLDPWWKDVVSNVPPYIKSPQHMY